MPERREIGHAEARSLVALVADAAKRPKKRTKTKPTRASKERRLDEKRRRSKTKRRRGKSTDDE